MKFLAASIIVGVACVGAFWYYTATQVEPALSPLRPYQANLDRPKLSQKSYGFLPYWQVNDDNLPLDKVSDIIFSGITITDALEIDRDPGWRQFNGSYLATIKDALASDQGYHVSITVFSTKAIETILHSDANQEQTLSLIESVVDDQTSGINIDFEPHRTTAATTSAELVNFMGKLRTRFPDKELSIDVYAHQSRLYIWDLPALAPIVDYIVFMSYDYNRAPSPRSGPVAPLRGRADYNWTADISYDLGKALQQVPAEKLLFGLATYGYGWQTVDTEFTSQTFPQTGRTVSLNTLGQFINSQEYPISYQWDPASLTPWLWYESESGFQQIYYDNQTSYAYKLDLVRQAQLGGTAIWALGYATENDWLWDAITSDR